MGERPRTRYARNGEVHLAFQAVGEGPLDLLLIDTWAHHVEAVWDFPDRQLARLQRFSVRPGAYGHYYRQTMEADVADVLPRLRVPTLVLNRTGNWIVPVAQSRAAAAAIRGARFVELPGTDHLAFSQGIDARPAALTPLRRPLARPGRPCSQSPPG
jgi:pimeloyl-ACP methyl ester carboxylesterase